MAFKRFQKIQRESERMLNDLGRVITRVVIYRYNRKTINATNVTCQFREIRKYLESSLIQIELFFWIWRFRDIRINGSMVWNQTKGDSERIIKILRNLKSFADSGFLGPVSPVRHFIKLVSFLV